MKSHQSRLVAAPHMPFHEDGSLVVERVPRKASLREGLEPLGVFAECAPVSDTSAARAPVAR